MATLIYHIIAKGSEGAQAASDGGHAWEAAAIMILPALIIAGACFADALR